MAGFLGFSVQMVTSNAKERVPPSADTKLAASEKKYDRAPVTQTIDNGPEQKPIQQKRFTYR
eukprot:3195932-Ditylum_brightwellii.AAC.1